MEYIMLDELMKIQKKGDSSKEKKNLYKEQMITLLIEEGFSTSAQKYIKEGFPFCGAEMIADYFSALDEGERKEGYSNLFHSQLFEENERGIAYKIAIHLMALELKKTNPDHALLKTLIIAIPTKNLGREGDPLKDAGKIIEKYFLKELKNKVELYSLGKVDLESGYLIAFSKHISSTIDTLSESKTLPMETIDRIKEWAKKQNPTYLASEKTKENENKAKEVASDKAPSHTAPNEFSIEETKQFFDSILFQMQRIQVSRRDLRKRAKELSELIVEKDEQIKMLQKNNELQEVQLKNCSIKLSEQTAENGSLLLKQTELIETIHREQNEINRLNAEIERLKTINSVYSADKASSQNEQLNAIASKLKAEYQDFCDAESMEMNNDLGENFRYQIKTIFKILKKAGIDVEGRL